MVAGGREAGVIGTEGRCTPRPPWLADCGRHGSQGAYGQVLLLRNLDHSRLDLVQAFSDPLANDICSLGVGLGDHVRKFLHVRQSGLEGGLNHFGLLGDLRFRSAGNHDLGGDSAGFFHGSLEDFSLTLHDRLDARDHELISFGQGFDVFPLGGDHRLKINAGHLEIGEHLGDVGLKHRKSGGFGHREFPCDDGR